MVHKKASKSLLLAAAAAVIILYSGCETFSDDKTTEIKKLTKLHEGDKSSPEDIRAFQVANNLKIPDYFLDFLFFFLRKFEFWFGKYIKDC